MSLHTKIKKIRQQPEHVRLRYVIIFSASSVFILFLFWIVSIKGTIATHSRKETGSSCSGITGTCNDPEQYQQENPLDSIPRSLNEMTTQ
ncbi:hypothetical protein ACFL08_03985 [Patescibacteria group bacterium]